jgi:hypothetical protein
MIKQSGKLFLIDKVIDVINSPVMFCKPVTGENKNSLFDFHNSRWNVEDGWLTGINPDESAGMAVFRQDFPGNILLEFDCRTVRPSTHDINFMWNGEWSDELNSCKNAMIGSICGWHLNRIGIEKSPGYKFRVTVPNNNFEPGVTYKVQAGSINNTSFIFVDGELALEADDPDPIDRFRYTKVAFTAWGSHIQIKNIIIRQINWKSRELKYIPEF